jgi:hypothetical protein
MTLASAFCACLVSCQSWVNMVTPPPQEDWDEARGKFPDTSNNRRLLNQMQESNLLAESRGDGLPPAYKSWDDFWDQIFTAIRSSSDNPEYYINYIKLRRKELGLPRS